MTARVDLRIVAPVTPKPPVIFADPDTPSEVSVPTVVIDVCPVYAGFIEIMLPVIEIVEPSPLYVPAPAV